jgi:radical SAM protein with 4Fe4S-binding SPASM domain
VSRITGEDELYDLKNDPQEKINQINNIEYKEILLQLKDKLGNFNEDRLEDIHNRAVETDYISRSKKNDRECQECRYYKVCRGGCFRNRDYQEKLDAYRNYFCQGYQYFFDHCLTRLEKMCYTIR